MGCKSVWVVDLKVGGRGMATPMVGGAAALLTQKGASPTPETVKAGLMKTATKNFPASSSVTDPTTGITYTDYYDIFTIGAGYLDVWGALNSTDVVPAGSTAASPFVQYNALNNTITMVNGASVIWGDSVGWGDSVVW